MAKSSLTHSKSNIWLIGHPCNVISGPRLPSGRDVMRNFIYFHRKQKLRIDDSAKRVLDNLLPFWIKSRLPTRDRWNILPKIKHLFGKQTNLMKHRSRSTEKDLLNQKQYTEKLDSLFDISHANADQMIKN